MGGTLATVPSLVTTKPRLGKSMGILSIGDFIMMESDIPRSFLVIHGVGPNRFRRLSHALRVCTYLLVCSTECSVQSNQLAGRAAPPAFRLESQNRTTPIKPAPRFTRSTTEYIPRLAYRVFGLLTSRWLSHRALVYEASWLTPRLPPD